MDNNSNNIRIEFDEANNQSLAFVNEVNAGECQFDIKDDKWYIVHTGVRPQCADKMITNGIKIDDSWFY